MHKVYLLLRNNQKSGPFSLDELLQLQLKPFDLVWVEGRSAGWRYPSEIDSLKAYVAEAPKPATPFEPIATAILEQPVIAQNISHQNAEPAKKVFVSMPKKPQQVYKMEEETTEQSFQQSEPIPRYAPGYEAPKTSQENPASTNYARTLPEVEDDYAKWIVQNRKRKTTSVSPKTIAALALVIVVLGAGYFIWKSPSTSGDLVSQSVQQPQSDAREVVKAEQPEEEVAVNASANEKKFKKKEKARKLATSPDKQTTTKAAPVVQKKKEEVEKPVVKTDPPPIVTDEKTIVKDAPKEKPATETATKEKKKKLGEVIKGIFKPKEKKEEKTDQVLEEPKPATNRQSTRREDQSTSAADERTAETNTAALAEQIDITSNAPDNWMMGIKGLKVTLRNRSSVTIQSATVDVVYYDDNNRVLERKTISFTNIAPKGKLTISAPDHKWADHVDFKLGAVVAKDDRYARN